MSRSTIFLCLVVVVIASCAGAAPAFALCATNTACAAIPPASNAQTIAGLVGGAWDGGDFDCSPDGLTRVKFKEPPPFNSPGNPIAVRTLDFVGSSTTGAHTFNIRLADTQVAPGVPLDMYVSVDSAPEVLIPDGLTVIGQFQLTAGSTQAGYSSDAVPALGTTYRIVLGLSVLAGALWLILRRSS